MKKSYTATFKAQVVLELLKETKTLNQLSSEYGVHATVLREWKHAAIKGLPDLFEHRDSVTETRAAYERQIEDLYAEIGRLTTHVNFLKKTSPVACDIPPGEKRSRLPPGALSPTIGCCIPKTRPTNLLVCGRRTSDQNP